MANTENTENLPTDLTELADLDTTELEVVTDEVVTDEVVTDTPVDLDAEWAQPEGAFRYLNWAASKPVRSAWTVDLTGFSTERQAGVRDLVNHGLVNERTWTGGANDGRVTFRVTELGRERLDAARAAASLVVLG